MEFFALADISLDKFGLMSELSIGQTRIISITSILISGSPFLLLDEPFAALSPIARRALVKSINHMKTDYSFLIAEHDIPSLSECTDDACVLVGGSIVAKFPSLKDKTEEEILDYFHA